MKILLIFSLIIIFILSIVLVAWWNPFSEEELNDHYKKAEQVGFDFIHNATYNLEDEKIALKLFDSLHEVAKEQVEEYRGINLLTYGDFAGKDDPKYKEELNNLILNDPNYGIIQGLRVFTGSYQDDPLSIKKDDFEIMNENSAILTVKEEWENSDQLTKRGVYLKFTEKEWEVYSIIIHSFVY